MAKVIGTIVVDIERCKGCAVCTINCPNDVLAMSKDVNGKGYQYVEMISDDCTGCTNCALVCPDSVITVYRKKI